MYIYIYIIYIYIYIYIYIHKFSFFNGHSQANVDFVDVFFRFLLICWFNVNV